MTHSVELVALDENFNVVNDVKEVLPQGTTSSPNPGFLQPPINVEKLPENLTPDKSGLKIPEEVHKGPVNRVPGTNYG